MTSHVTEEELAGARPYSPGLLAAYDLWVLGFNNYVVWRCPTTKLLAMYNQNISDAHLDVGPGSGWFLRHVRFPGRDAPEVALVDLNEHSLAKSRRGLLKRHVRTTTRVASVLAPLPVDRQYTSVAASLLMHCVPGTWDTKGVAAFRNVADATTDDGVFFGATVLSHGVRHTRLSRAVAGWFNSKQAFHNEHDDLVGLSQSLYSAWSEVELDVIGSMAVWTARRPQRTSPAADPQS
jgi:hypothetical protein